MSDERIDIYLRESGWAIAHDEIRHPKQQENFRYDELPLAKASLRALEPFQSGIYLHQREAIESYLSGANVAVTTPTASGKTLIFNVCAIQELLAKPEARIAAIYPLKALATEQTERWQKLVREAGLSVKVGRIDGGVKTPYRQKILKESRILIFTPDIIHAWLLSNLASPAVLGFIKNLSLIILDEAHTYSGVFGSNSAFLIRRLLHVSRRLKNQPRFIASSATMREARTHLANLTGEDFIVIGPEMDTSPRAALRMILAEPPQKNDVLTAVSDLVAFATTETNHQSITFVDSRKQTEYLASIIERRIGEGATDSDEVDFDRFGDLQIYPYRSGYEEEDRERIQDKLASGQLKGVVSTSALEMGIDLPYLSLGILLGMPRSATSFYQRIGRVGRRKDGVVVVVNSGSVVSESIFREPSRIKSLPFVQSALYLHNQRIQYIHAMCLARPGGEDEIVTQRLKDQNLKFASDLALPSDFLQLCEAERVGEISPELQAMKAQAGDDPNHTFPLRDLDVQYRVECKRGPEVSKLGSLSQGQLMREAYPGAVYYYQTRPYRVVRVRKHQRLIDVRPEKRYFTTPEFLPTLILPNMSGDNVFRSQRYGDLIATECALQVGEAVVGFKERRGSNEIQVRYPLDPALGLFHDAPRFARYAFTSGVVFSHPALDKERVKCSPLAEILGEAFLMSLPFERQDISAGSDKHRATREGITEGERFLCVYDQTYGSLRLTSHLMKSEVIREVLGRANEIARNDKNFELNKESRVAIAAMAASVSADPVEAVVTSTRSPSTDRRYIRVVLPGSKGINLRKDNEEFEVEGVFFSPQLGKLAYRGCHLSEKKKAQSETWRHSTTTVAVAAEDIHPLEGESKIGFYNVDTGELLLDLPAHGEF